ncbi:hypothetical protein Tco_1289480, partial [Tanacetum coccineum]
SGKSSISSGKSSSSGNLGSGRDTLTVGKISSSGNQITSSENALAFYSKHKLNVEREERSLINTSFFGEYECSSLALDREERWDEEDKIGSLETRSKDVSD